MKKITLFFLIVLTQITFGQAKITETEKLVATCKVWGFLKYYHPKVANGEFNWDQQLLDILPKIEKAQTKAEFSLILENWIDDLGAVPEIAPIAAEKDVEYFDKNFDLSWFNNTKFFSKKLSKKLKFIEENRFQGEQFYIYTMSGGGNVDLKNESYKNPDFTDKNSKLRMIFMFWNLIEYFFPDKYLMDQKWDRTLEKVIPLAIKAENQDDFYLTMRKMISRLDDSHTEFFVYQSSAAQKIKRYFPANGRIIDDKLVVTEILGDSLAQAYDIKVGDVITKINDKTIKEISLENRELICASNEPKYLEKLVKKVLLSNSDIVKVEFLKNDEYITKTMTWFDYHDSHRNEFKKGAQKKKEKFKLLDRNIGYVDMGVIKPKHIPDMIEALKSTQAIIFDMRNYPNGTFEPIGNFINPKEEKFAMYTRPDLSHPGRFKWSDNATTMGFDNKDYYKGKVIVLLDEKSQSQAEWTAMCFQTSGHTTIIGSQTAGADGNVSEFDFEGFHTLFSGIGVFYPDKRETQRIGIVPDIEVKPTIKGIQEGRDEVLDRALVFIETGT